MNPVAPVRRTLGGASLMGLKFHMWFILFSCEDTTAYQDCSEKLIIDHVGSQPLSSALLL